jgi:hypothetical protein
VDLQPDQKIRITYPDSKYGKYGIAGDPNHPDWGV